MFIAGNAPCKKKLGIKTTRNFFNFVKFNFIVKEIQRDFF